MPDIEGFVKKYVSSRRKTSLWSVLARKPVSTTRNTVFIEKYVLTIWKNCLFWQKKTKMVFTSRKILLCLNWFPLISIIMVSSNRKKAMNKSILFPLDSKLVSTTCYEGFIEIYVFTRRKRYFRWQERLKRIGENGFHYPETKLLSLY